MKNFRSSQPWILPCEYRKSLKKAKFEMWCTLEENMNYIFLQDKSGQLEWTTGEIYIFITLTALWIVLQQKDQNIQLNVIIMPHVAYQSLSNFSLRRWGGRHRGIKNEA